MKDDPQGVAHSQEGLVQKLAHFRKVVYQKNGHEKKISEFDDFGGN
jgi:hypothetical protein